eukprot:TRINITY_DN35798_c0_g1_i1.p1 TRINITY_DN35798_c0_g1~~TRINITY_DN35798_c0_g1_i1.p1  ORF type:complete len:175 (+),score=34.00 TRINITY_DN35798_c0_g1_i1:2-526(+)
MRRVSRGMQILQERPLLLLTAAEQQTYREAARELRAAGTVCGSCEGMLQAKVTSLSQGEQRAFWALHDCYGSESALGIVATNGMDLSSAPLQMETTGSEDTGGTRPQPGGLGVFQQAARFNHSCAPSTTWTWQKATGELWLFALRPIECGEEMTIHYGGQTVICYVSERARFSC